MRSDLLARLLSASVATALVLLAAASAHAQSAAGQSPSKAPANAELAQQLSNPVANLVSVPVQFNWDQPVGPDRDTRFTMNFQPVVPIPINDRWNMIARWIMPYVAQPRLSESGLPTSGLSDIVASVFFSPAKVGRVIWGAGPVVQLPTNADPLLGSGKWAAGPTVVVLQTRGQWTYGALVNHLWSFAGDNFTGGVARQNVNATLLQPFLAYTTKKAVSFSTSIDASANWEADEHWTVPINFSVSRLIKFGPYPMSVGGNVGIFLAAPGGLPDWRLRITTTLLLPRQ